MKKNFRTFLEAHDQRNRFHSRDNDLLVLSRVLFFEGEGGGGGREGVSGGDLNSVYFVIE